MEKQNPTKETSNEVEVKEVHDPGKDRILAHFGTTPAQVKEQRFQAVTAGRLVKKEGSGVCTGVINFTEYTSAYSDAEKAKDRARDLNSRYFE